MLRHFAGAIVIGLLLLVGTVWWIASVAPDAIAFGWVLLTARQEKVDGRPDGVEVEDPQLHELRAAVHEAAFQIEADPCDPETRERLGEALKKYWAYDQRSIPKRETMIKNGYRIDARGYLNRDAENVTIAAMQADIIEWKLQVLVGHALPRAPNKRQTGRFACESLPK
jgi:hypothetical protein